MKTFNYTDVFGIVDETLRSGVGLAANILNSSFAESLTKELGTHEYHTTKTDDGLVRQEFRVAAYKTIPDRFPVLQKLSAHTERLMVNSGFQTLFFWRARDVSIQRYRGPTNSISTHRDLKRHTKIIVIFNVAGSCDFEILASRNGPVTKIVRPQPGDMVLLRALGLGFGWNEWDGDDRPYHRVSGNTSTDPERISIGFRDDKKPENPKPSFYKYNRG